MRYIITPLLVGLFLYWEVYYAYIAAKNRKKLFVEDEDFFGAEIWVTLNSIFLIVLVAYVTYFYW